jgi:hypothetical protein
MQTARDVFNRGDRVVLSDKGEEHNIRPAKMPRTGTVVGFGRDPQTVTIVPDGTKTTIACHMSFWRLNEADRFAASTTPHDAARRKVQGESAAQRKEGEV